MSLWLVVFPSNLSQKCVKDGWPCTWWRGFKFNATENANRYRLLAFPIPSNFGMSVERPLLVVPRT